MSCLHVVVCEFSELRLGSLIEKVPAFELWLKLIGRFGQSETLIRTRR